MQNFKFDELSTVEACVEFHIGAYADELRTINHERFVKRRMDLKTYILYLRDLAKRIDGMADFYIKGGK